MAATLEIGRLTLGSGRPKIIVPIVGATEDNILAAAQEIADHPLIDLVEWRADHYENALDGDITCQMLAKLQAALQEKPLLYTFRTAREGGQKAIAARQYIALCEAVAQSGKANLIDVEMFFEDAANSCVERIHAQGIAIVGSWHNFNQTPGKDDLLRRFARMQEMGADVLKIAVMPHCLADVEHLMEAAREMHATAHRPLCAISMSDLGRITRTGCQHFGGCMTFGALGATSAPGQISIDQLHEALQKS